MLVVFDGVLSMYELNTTNTRGIFSLIAVTIKGKVPFAYKGGNMKKDYRKIYSRYYGIDFNQEYVIHHMDFDHTNNDIDNLLLLPDSLHAKYHMLVNRLGGRNGKLNVDIRVNAHAAQDAEMLEQLGSVLKEMHKWLIYKGQLEIRKRTRG